MGGIKSSEKSKFGGRPPGKIDASLSEKLKNVEWGKYRLGDLFSKSKVNSLKYKTSELPSTKYGDYNLPALTAGIQNQGLNNFVPRKNATILKDVITISANGANTGATFYQSKEFTVLQDSYAIEWIYTQSKPTGKQYLFMASAISKTIYGNYEWTNKAGWEKIKNEKIQLPTKNGEIDFEFMESFIAELSAYLSVSGLDNYELSSEEEKALRDYENCSLQFDQFKYKMIFNQIKQGRRLKKDDQLPGNIPFVMSGITNNGVVGYVSNPVASFPANSITLDIFGNAFYRNYSYGAGDDTGVYWNDKKTYSKTTMLFLTSAMEKSIKGKFSYGKKLRSSQSYDFLLNLPTKNGEPDFATMEMLISAVQKLVIKAVVLYADRKIEATKKVVSK